MKILESNMRQQIYQFIKMCKDCCLLIMKNKEITSTLRVAYRDEKVYIYFDTCNFNNEIRRGIIHWSIGLCPRRFEPLFNDFIEISKYKIDVHYHFKLNQNSIISQIKMIRFLDFSDNDFYLHKKIHFGDPIRNQSIKKMMEEFNLTWEDILNAMENFRLELI